MKRRRIELLRGATVQMPDLPDPSTWCVAISEHMREVYDYYKDTEVRARGIHDTKELARIRTRIMST